MNSFKQKNFKKSIKKKAEYSKKECYRCKKELKLGTKIYMSADKSYCSEGCSLLNEKKIIIGENKEKSKKKNNKYNNNNKNMRSLFSLLNQEKYIDALFFLKNKDIAAPGYMNNFKQKLSNNTLSKIYEAEAEIINNAIKAETNGISFTPARKEILNKYMTYEPYNNSDNSDNSDNY